MPVERFSHLKRILIADVSHFRWANAPPLASPFHGPCRFFVVALESSLSTAGKCTGGCWDLPIRAFAGNAFCSLLTPFFPPAMCVTSFYFTYKNTFRWTVLDFSLRRLTKSKLFIISDCRYDVVIPNVDGCFSNILAHTFEEPL